MHGYANPAKRPFDRKVSYVRSMDGLVTMAPLQSQLDGTDELVGALSEKFKEEFTVFNKELKAHARTLKQVRVNFLLSWADVFCYLAPDLLDLTSLNRNARLDVANIIENCLSHVLFLSHSMANTL